MTTGSPEERTASDDDAMMDAVAARLSVRFPEVPPSAVRDVVAHTYGEISDAHIRDFIAVLVEKQAKQTLRTLKRSKYSH